MFNVHGMSRPAPRNIEKSKVMVQQEESSGSNQEEDEEDAKE